MKTLTIFALLFLLAVYIIFMSIMQPEFFHAVEFDVRVINGFTDNSSLPLVIWCASPDDNLGGRALQEGDDFSWSLKTKFWGSTHFLCTMKWDRKKKSFDAFRVHRDSHRCGPHRKCFWLVKEDGFYFSNDEVNWKKYFSWS